MNQEQTRIVAGGHDRERLAAAAALRATDNSVLACMALSVLSVLGVFFYAPLWWEALDFARHAAQTQALLDDGARTGAADPGGLASSASSKVAFTYTVDGREYRGEDTTPQRPQGTMPVFYDPRAPGVGRLDPLADLWSDTAILGCLLLVVVVATVGLLVFRARWRVLRAILIEKRSRTSASFAHLAAHSS